MTRDELNVSSRSRYLSPYGRVIGTCEKHEITKYSIRSVFNNRPYTTRIVYKIKFKRIKLCNVKHHQVIRELTR